MIKQILAVVVIVGALLIAGTMDYNDQVLMSHTAELNK